MAEETIRGKAWVAKDYVMAYDIIKQEFWTAPLNPEENAKWVMANVDPAFNSENAFKSAGYTFIVAGHNFAGGGKSIEHVITGLMGAGIKAVLADSFARLQFRNAINYGMPFITCRNIIDSVSTGDELEVDLATGTVRNLTRNTEHQAAPVAKFVQEIAAAGGLLGYVRQKIADGTVNQLR
jgi:3-isopropylmalate/(R)-2-methylmalate dehydratase small subunit